MSLSGLDLDERVKVRATTFLPVSSAESFQVPSQDKPSIVEDLHAYVGAARENGLLYRFRAVGKNGVPFTAFKLQTMHPDADARRAERFAHATINARGKPEEDPGLLPGAGRLRKLHLDELPQLYNVLRGEMQLFGIRAKTHEYWNAHHTDRHLEIAQEQKPGFVPVAYVFDDSYLAKRQKERQSRGVWDGHRAQEAMERLVLRDINKSPWKKPAYLASACMNVIGRRVYGK